MKRLLPLIFIYLFCLNAKGETTIIDAVLIKHGSGSSSQTIDLGSPIVGFYYNWENATTAL